MQCIFLEKKKKNELFIFSKRMISIFYRSRGNAGFLSIIMKICRVWYPLIAQTHPYDIFGTWPNLSNKAVVGFLSLHFFLWKNLPFSSLALGYGRRGIGESWNPTFTCRSKFMELSYRISSCAKLQMLKKESTAINESSALSNMSFWGHLPITEDMFL